MSVIRKAVVFAEKTMIKEKQRKGKKRMNRYILILITGPLNRYNDDIGEAI
jgi:hypothetical protein